MFSLNIELEYITTKEWRKNHSRNMDVEDRTYSLQYLARFLPFSFPFQRYHGSKNNEMKIKKKYKHYYT